jgi:hypothetical protein
LSNEAACLASAVSQSEQGCHEVVPEVGAVQRELTGVQQPDRVTKTIYRDADTGGKVEPRPSGVHGAQVKRSLKNPRPPSFNWAWSQGTRVPDLVISLSIQ